MIDNSVDLSIIPEPVTIGNFTLFCESFFAERTRIFSEQNTTDGNIIFTNTGKKAMKITLKGRVYDDALPTRFLIATDALINSGEPLNFVYKGTVFKNCHIVSFSTEDKGENFIHASVTLITDTQTTALSCDEQEDVF